MAARWIGLSRPTKKSFAARAKRGLAHTFRECVHAIGAVGVLAMAAGMNFALYPDALAAVVTGEPVATGFVPEEPNANAALPGTPVVVDEEEVHLLAATAWGEARGEGEAGMRAVAHVMVNRVGDRFGEDLRTVILSPRQFSVWNRGDPNRRLVLNPERYATGGEALQTWEEAQRIAREVLSGQSVDPTNGALFYHTRAVRPTWARLGQGRQVIGAHIFYADVPDRGQRRTPQRITSVAQTFDPPLTIDAPRQGARAGRVNGVIQHAPANAAAQASAPLPSSAPSPEAQAAIAELPTSSSF